MSKFCSLHRVSSLTQVYLASLTLSDIRSVLKEGVFVRRELRTHTLAMVII